MLIGVLLRYGSSFQEPYRELSCKLPRGELQDNATFVNAVGIACNVASTAADVAGVNYLFDQDHMGHDTSCGHGI